MKKVLSLFILFISLTLVFGCGNRKNVTTTAYVPEFKNVADSFMIAVIPDSQKASQYYPDVLKSQMRWIADNSADYNIKFTVHVGDIVQNAQNRAEWMNASEAYEILDEAMIPYGVVAGNHDVYGNMAEMYQFLDNNRPETAYYLEYFTRERAEKYTDHFGGMSDNGWNSYYFFEANNRTYLVLMFDYAASPETYQWAANVLKEHKDKPAILVTHRLTNPVGTEGAAEVSCANCNDMFFNLIYKNDNIFLTISGHWVGSGYTIKQNRNRRDVVMMVVDYSDNYRGGNGYTRLIEFDEKNNMIYTRTISPYVMTIPETERGENDIVEMDDKANKQAIPFNFKERFTFDN